MLIFLCHPTTFEVIYLHRLLKSFPVGLGCKTLVWLTTVGRIDQRLLVNHTKVFTPIKHHINNVIVYRGFGLDVSPWYAHLVASSNALPLSIQTSHFNSFLAPKHQLLLFKYRITVLKPFQ